MSGRRWFVLWLSLAILFTGPGWPGGTALGGNGGVEAMQGRAEEMGVEQSTEYHILRSTASNATDSSARAPEPDTGSGQQKEPVVSTATPGGAQEERGDTPETEISQCFVQRQINRRNGTLRVDGDTVWYLNYIKDTADKSYAYEVLDQSGSQVDQTWWNYWWVEELNGWRIQAKPTQYSRDGEDYHYFIMDDDGLLTEGIPAVIDGKPVVSMDECFSAWPMPLREPGVIADTVVSAVSCYRASEITCMPELPENLQNMNYMFAECAELTDTMPIPAAVEHMDYAFAGTAIEETPEFMEGSAVRELKNTFDNCTQLKSVPNLPDGVERLDGTFWCAFEPGADLSDLQIPESVTEMEDTFFRSGIGYAPRLPGALQKLDRCFDSCRNLQEVPLLPDTIRSAPRAFAYCSGLQFGTEDHACVVAPRSLENADQMFMYAYQTAGKADSWGRDSELLYLWDEAQWECINRHAYGEAPADTDRDAYGDYIIYTQPIGLAATELLVTGPYIENELVLQDGKRAMAITFRGVLGRYGVEPDYYPGDVIQYRTGGTGEFQDWDGNPVYVYEDTLVEARKIRTIETYEGMEEVVTGVRAKQISVQQPDAPVFSSVYKGGGIYDVTIMYRPFLRSLSRVELKYRINDGPWRSIENLGHVRAGCEDIIYAYADWGAVSETVSLRLPDYVKRIEVANPAVYTGLNDRIPLVCGVYEESAGDRTYRVELVDDPAGIAAISDDGAGNWSISNRGYGDATIRVTACDGSGATADHTFSFGSRIQGISVALEENADGTLDIGEKDRVTVSVTPPDLGGYTLAVSDASILALDPETGIITGRQGGTVTITAVSTADPAVSQSLTVQVLRDPETIVLTPETAEVYSDERVELYGRWYQEDASAPEITQAGMAADWRETGRGTGWIRLEVAARDENSHGITDVSLRGRSSTAAAKTAEITWKPFIHELTLHGPERLAAGNRADTWVDADVESDEILSYTSSDPSVLEVGQDGTLTAVKEGQAIVTVTTSHGGVTGQITVEVTEPENRDITGLQLILEKEILHVGESCGYQVVTQPRYTAGSYTVASSAPDVLEVTDGDAVKANAPGTATVYVREDNDPEGGTPAVDQVEVTVVPNNTAVLTVFPEDQLWERDSVPVIYKNLAGGDSVKFACRVVTDSPDRSVSWSVDRGDLAEIDENGVLSPRRNGTVVVTAASNAYPNVTAAFSVEIRTVATDIHYSISRQGIGGWEDGFIVTAKKFPEDASPERIYCRRAGSQDMYEDITEQGYKSSYDGVWLEFSTCASQPGIEDTTKTAMVQCTETRDGRYELRSMHDDAPYTVLISDLDESNRFPMRIYDTVEKRYLGPGDNSGIYWSSFFPVQRGWEDNTVAIQMIDVIGEMDSVLTLGLSANVQLNGQDNLNIDIPFLSETGSLALAVRVYHICSVRDTPQSLSFRCLDQAGSERYNYDLSVFTGGIPEFHWDVRGTSGYYTAVNCEQGQAFLDINGETFSSLEVCLNRYNIVVYRGLENVTDRVMKRVDYRGRPCITLMDEGVYTVHVTDLEGGAGVKRQITAVNARDFLYMLLASPNEDGYMMRNCSIYLFRGSKRVRAYGVPYGVNRQVPFGLYLDEYTGAWELTESQGYEVSYELLPDSDGVVRGVCDGQEISAKGFTGNTPDFWNENVRAVVKKDGEIAAYIYGAYEVRGQMPRIVLPSNEDVEAGRECQISLQLLHDVYGSGVNQIKKADIEGGLIHLALDEIPVEGPGVYGDFEVTYLRDGAIGIVCSQDKAAEAKLEAWIDGSRIYELTGDSGYQGEEVSRRTCYLRSQGTASAAVEDVHMNVREAADLTIRCSLGGRPVSGRITKYQVLNAPPGSTPLRINSTRINGLAAGTWLVQATVDFSTSRRLEAVCQFRVTIKNPARELRITERSGRTACYVGESLYLLPASSPEEADNITGYVWSVKDQGQEPGVQVSDEGVVTAGKAGDYVIMLQDLPDRSLTAEYAVHVEERPVRAAEIQISPKQASVTNYETVACTALVLPEDSADQNVVWEVAGADGRQAHISQDGVFQGLKTGEYTVRCFLASDSEIQDTAAVQVNVLPEKVHISGPSGAEPGQVIDLRAEVFPEDAVYEGINWEVVSGNGYANISADGRITCADTAGRVEIRATVAGTEISASHELLIGSVVPELKLEVLDGAGAVKEEIMNGDDPAYLYIDGNRATRACILDGGYEISIMPDRTGLVLDAAGVIHGLQAGNYTVTASRKADGVTVRDAAALTVLESVRYSYLKVFPKDGNYRIINRGGSKDMGYLLTPKLWPEDQIVWSILAGEEIAEIDQGGKLTAKGVQNGPVTVKCAVVGADGTEVITQNCVIVVSGQVIQVTGIKINCANQVEAGKSTPVTVTVYPENANNREYEIQVSNSEVGEIADGALQARAPGEVRITAVALGNRECVDSVVVCVVDREDAGEEVRPGPDSKPDRVPDSGSQGGDTAAVSERVDRNALTFWYLRDGAWYYYTSEGQMVKNSWVLYRGQWYRLGIDGVMYSNRWYEEDRKRWYLSNNGAMLAGGWARVDGQWHYFDQEGCLHSEIMERDGFIKKDRDLVYTGPEEGPWVAVGPHIYYLNNKHVLTNQWIKDGQEWYYAGDNGWILQNQWNEVDGSWYFMKPDGRMERESTIWEGGLYYMDQNGVAWNTRERKR